MTDQQLASRRLKCARRLKRRAAEYDEYTAVLERKTRRLARIAPFARVGELRRISINVRSAADVFARAANTCTAIGATPAVSALRDARQQILAALDRFLAEVAQGNIGSARAILITPLRGAGGVFREALQAVGG